MTPRKKLDRRPFPKNTAVPALILGAPIFIPASALGREVGKPAPSNRLHVGGLGLGGCPGNVPERRKTRKLS